MRFKTLMVGFGTNLQALKHINRPVTSWKHKIVERADVLALGSF